MSLALLREPGGAVPPLLAAARAVLRPEDGAHVVGGAVRDAALGRPLHDLDVVLPGDPRSAARAVARAVGGSGFPLSHGWGGWRVTGPDGAHLDLLPRQGESLDEDLACRDLTVNAVAVPLHGGATHDPHGGLADLAARVLRVVGPDAMRADPLRVLRLARLAADLDATPDAATLDAARAATAELGATAGERASAELLRALGGDRPLRAAELLDALGVRDALLGDPSAGRGATGATAARLERSVALTDAPLVALDGAAVGTPVAHDPADAVAERPGPAALSAAARAHLDHELAAGVPRAVVLRLLAWAGEPGDGGPLLARLRAPGRAVRLDRELRGAAHGPPAPHDAAALWEWLEGRREPVAALLAAAAEPAATGEVAARARALLPLALAWADGPPSAPLLRGERLVALGVAPGPAVGAAQRRVAAARFAGRVRDAAEAEALVRAGLDEPR